jgi:hypothetical protein
MYLAGTQLLLPMDWQAVSAAPQVHVLLSTGTVDPRCEDNSSTILTSVTKQNACTIWNTLYCIVPKPRPSAVDKTVSATRAAVPRDPHAFHLQRVVA